MKKRSMRKHLEYKVPKLTLAMVREEKRVTETITLLCVEDAAPLVEPLKHYTEEYFVGFHLNSKSQVIGYHEVSHGTLSASLVHPREVFKAALLSNAHSLLLGISVSAKSRKKADELVSKRLDLSKLQPLENEPTEFHEGFILHDTNGLWYQLRD